MTEQRRTVLLTACCFAREFIKAADAEIRGGRSSLHEQEQLQAALRNLHTPAPNVPTVDWSEVGRQLDAE